jgi:mRNA interferase MazF
MKRGDVFWVDLPLGAGRAQAGLRPVILMQDDEGPPLCPTLVVVPLTSQMAATRFAHTVVLSPGSHSGLRVSSVALVAQITAVDRTLFRQQLGTLTAAEYEQECSILAAMITPPTGGSPSP